MLVPELAGERSLGALLAKDAVLLGRQLCAPLGVGLGLGDLVSVVSVSLMGGILRSVRDAAMTEAPIYAVGTNATQQKPSAGRASAASSPPDALAATDDSIARFIEHVSCRWR